MDAIDCVSFELDREREENAHHLQHPEESQCEARMSANFSRKRANVSRAL
jgi:hypothetical protein